MTKTIPALLALLLASCAVEVDTGSVPIHATLDCAKGVRCHIYEWNVGFRRGAASIGGTHAHCRCYDQYEEERRRPDPPQMSVPSDSGQIL